MKGYVLKVAILFICFTYFNSNAQGITFEKYTDSTFTIADFEGVSYSSIAFADIDGDNDQDVLIAGENNLS